MRRLTAIPSSYRRPAAVAPSSPQREVFTDTEVEISPRRGLSACKKLPRKTSATHRVYPDQRRSVSDLFHGEFSNSEHLVKNPPKSYRATVTDAGPSDQDSPILSYAVDAPACPENRGRDKGKGVDRGDSASASLSHVVPAFSTPEDKENGIHAGVAAQGNDAQPGANHIQNNEQENSMSNPMDTSTGQTSTSSSTKFDNTLTSSATQTDKNTSSDGTKVDEATNVRVPPPSPVTPTNCSAPTDGGLPGCNPATCPHYITHHHYHHYGAGALKSGSSISPRTPSQTRLTSSLSSGGKSPGRPKRVQFASPEVSSEGSAVEDYDRSSVPPNLNP